MSKVAIVTGGASGLGLAVATAMAKDPSTKWSVHILDISAVSGEAAASTIGAAFHQCDVTNYTSLSSVFHQIYRQHGRVDVVHANAGIIEPADFFADLSEGVKDGPPPPPPDMKVMDIDLTGVIYTAWLALHYFRLTRQAFDNDAAGAAAAAWEGNLVMTASAAGIYASFQKPLYTAAKYGVTGFTRSLAQEAHLSQNVRVNCICPGAVLTAMTAGFGIGPEHLTPIENVVRAVLMLIAGRGAVDSTGVEVKDGEMYGRAVEVTRDHFRFREMPGYSDDLMGILCGDPRLAGGQWLAR